MSSSTETSKAQIGNGDGTSAPAMVQEEELVGLPRDVVPEEGTGTKVAYDLMTNELLLDGSARLNLATFVTTWMPPDAARLMAETADKNMIDKDEYPQTAEFERRCVNMIGRLWHAPGEGDVTGCSTTGSSEAAMLGGLALKWLWRERMRAAGKPTDRPNLVLGINVQVCWDKFCRYWDVEPRLVPMEGDRFHLTAEAALPHCDENTIGVVAILGSTFDGSYEPVSEICAALDELAAGGGPDIPVHVDAASGGFVAPFSQPDLVWDFALPRVHSINSSGHKYGLVYPGVGWAIWRDEAALPRDLVFDVNYLGGSMPTFALNFSRPGSEVLAQYFMLLALGQKGLRGDPALLEPHRPPHRKRNRRDRPVSADHRRQRAAGGCVHAHTRGDQLHRVRRLRAAARVRVAGARLHVPREPGGPIRVAGCGARRAHQRHGRPIPRRHAQTDRMARVTRGTHADAPAQ